MMDQNNWDTFSPIKSENYFEMNDQLMDIKNDQFLLNHIDQNLYDGHKSTPKSGSADIHTTNLDLHDETLNEDPLNKLNDFSLDNYNFDMNEDYDATNTTERNQNEINGNSSQFNRQSAHHSTHNSSSAFPPSHSSVQNTPNIQAHKHQHLMREQPISSPILPSQNDKSFNNQHYYHKLLRNKSKEALEHMPQLQHVRPDVIFTPLMSPHDAPVDLKNKYVAQTSFEPLTSPALRAQNNHSSDKRRSLLLVFTTVDENKSSNFKRRTPHGTPILHSNVDSSGNFDRLPDASISTSSSSTPMLPPHSYKKIDSESTNTSPQMMGFTMGKLAKQKPQLQLPRQSPTIDSRKSSYTSSRSAETSPMLMPAGKEKPASKKASHKLAEQGRRNRMNSAVQTLGSLIPKRYHDQVSVPSKATTVELAATYIQDLLEELEQAKSAKKKS